MSAPLLLAALVAGAVSVLVVGFVVVQVITVRNGSLRQAPPSPARRITIALAVSLVAAIGISEVLLVARGGTSFATAGEQRYLSSPFVYGAFALIAAATTRHFVPRWPFWVVGLLAVTLLSTLFSPLAGPRFTTGTLIQGLVLLGGTALFAVCGLLAAEWTPRQRQRLLKLLLGSGAVAGVLALGTGIFSALVLPTAVALVYLARERVRLWPIWGVLGVVIIVQALIANADAVDPSAAGTGQLVVAAGVFGLAALPRPARPVLVGIAVVIGVVALIGSDVPGLFIGRGAQLDDVTLAERAYETQQVVRQAGGNPFALLFGAGPGATVDLTRSPDVATLAGSGRVLAAVPSVHLLTSHVLMKTGLIGLLWLGFFLFAAGAAAVRVLKQRRPDLFDLVLVVFVLCGIVQAIPAATFLFSNPLPALLLAILHVRRMQAEEGWQLGRFDPPRRRARERSAEVAPAWARPVAVRRAAEPALRYDEEPSS